MVAGEIKRPLAIDREFIKLNTPKQSIDELRTNGNGCLFAVVDILGSDVLSHEARTVSQKQYLHKRYCHALNLLQSALESPAEACSDHLLIAILLLGTIEAKISPQKVVEDWVTHIQGASDLLQYRGSDQVSTRMGAVLYLQASTQLFTTCLLTGVAVPDQFYVLAKSVLQRVSNPQDMIWRNHEAMLTFVQFVCAESSKGPRSWNDAESVRDVVLRALKIHQMFESLFEDYPPIWRYTTHKTDHGVQHTYRSCLAAQLWNGRQVTTVTLFDIVQEAASYFEEETWRNLTPAQRRQVRDAKDIINTAAEGILASILLQAAFIRAQIALAAERGRIPGIAQWHTTQVFHHVSATERNDEDVNGKLPLVMFNGGFWCFFAIYFAASSHNIDGSTRARL